MLHYYNSDIKKLLPQNMKDALERYFGNGEYGVSEVLLDWKTNDVTLVTIDKVEYTGGGRHGDETKWTHYANIQLYDGDVWELNEQFKGKSEDEMWIYGYYKSFGYAVRNLATKGIKNRKPIEIYK